MPIEVAVLGYSQKRSSWYSCSIISISTLLQRASKISRDVSRKISHNPECSRKSSTCAIAGGNQLVPLLIKSYTSNNITDSIGGLDIHFYNVFRTWIYFTENLIRSSQFFWFWKRKSFFLSYPFSSLRERGSLILFLISIFEIWARCTLYPFKNFIKFSTL